MLNFARNSICFLLAAAYFAEGTLAIIARQATSTGSPAPSITLPPFLNFGDEEIQPTTCNPVSVEWFYNGPLTPLDLIVTNVGVSQADPAPSLSTSRQNTFTNARRAIPTGASGQEPSSYTVTIGTVPISQLFYIWPQVNVPQGWYIINGSIPALSYTASSLPFFVHSGTDTSCLLPPTPEPSSSSNSPSAPTGTPTSTPIGATGSNTNLGAIVGASIGAVALVAAVLLTWLCLYRKNKRSKGTSGKAGGDYPSVAHRWNGLSSTDSRAAFTGAGRKGSARHNASRTTSVGTILNTGSEEVVGAEKADVDADPFGDRGMGLLPSRTPGRTYSAASSVSNAYGENVFATPARRPSVPDSVVLGGFGGRRSVDSTTYPPTSPVRGSTNQYSGVDVDMYRNGAGSQYHVSTPSQSTSSHHNGSTSPAIAQPSSHHHPPRINTNTHSIPSPISPSTNSSTPDRSTPTATTSKQTNRQSFGKKRKPVPTYDPKSSPSAPSPIPPSPIPPSPSPGPAYGHDSGSSTNVSVNGTAHYATRSQTALGNDTSRPELAHKSSFGPGGIVPDGNGKQLHYLIPDMPMEMK